MTGLDHTLAVEVVLTIFKLTETSRRAGGPAGTGQYMDACAFKKRSFSIWQKLRSASICLKNWVAGWPVVKRDFKARSA